jgi:kynurenine formamidase
MATHRKLALVLTTVSLIAGLAWLVAVSAPAQDKSSSRKPAATPSRETANPTLDELIGGKLKIVDLGWPLNDKGPFWPAENYEPFRLKTIATLENNGVLSKFFCSPEHLGTHLDAPNHFEKNQPSVDQIDPANLFAAGVVVDISTQADADADYRLTRADLDEWEKRNGRIPGGALVLLKTGWGRFWDNPARYRSQDAAGKMHFPGYSVEAARWLVQERHIKGVGIDTLSIDYGPSKDFAVHHIVNSVGRYALENLAALERLPVRGFFVVVAPIKIETGSGGPARVFAILPNSD